MSSSSTAGICCQWVSDHGRRQHHHTLVHHRSAEPDRGLNANSQQSSLLNLMNTHSQQQNTLQGAENRLQDNNYKKIPQVTTIPASPSEENHKSVKWALAAYELSIYDSISLGATLWLNNNIDPE